MSSGEQPSDWMLLRSVNAAVISIEGSANEYHYPPAVGSNLLERDSVSRAGNGPGGGGAEQELHT